MVNVFANYTVPPVCLTSQNLVLSLDNLATLSVYVLMTVTESSKDSQFASF